MSLPHQAAGRTSCLVRTSDEAGTSTRPAKKARKQVKEQKKDVGDHSDGYSSDTEVDDPDEEDMDTDEEQAISLSPVKPNKDREKANTVKQGQRNGEENGQSESKHPKPDDSQELFNASLEAELYPPSTRIVKEGSAAATSSIKTVSHSPTKPASQPPPQLTRSKIAEPITSPTVSKPKDDDDDNTHRSIVYDLF